MERLIKAYSLLALALIGFVFGNLAYGLYLAFSASVVVGFVFLFAPPLAFVTGAVKVISGIDLAARLATALGLA